MNNTSKVYLLSGLFLSLSGSGVLLSFIYTVIYDTETVEILTLMDPIKRTFILCLVVLGIGLLCYQGQKFMEEAIDMRGQQSLESGSGKNE